jgi:uncharacterized protein YjdB
VATVDANGNVTAVSVGTATITVTTNDGGFSATSTVTVSSSTIAVSSVSVSPTDLTLTVGQSGSLTATVSPLNATDQSVSWSSSNTSVAIVDVNGNVTAVSAGTATITVTTIDGGYIATATVSVSEVATGTIPISLRLPLNAVFIQSINDGDVIDLSVIGTSDLGITADVTGVGSVVFELSGVQSINQTESRAPYSMTGDGSGNLNVWTATPGYYTLTVTTYSEKSGGGSILDQNTISFTIIEGSSSTVAVTGVSVSPTSLSLEEGQTGSLSATVSPSNATDKSITWTSSDQSVATVGASGLVTGIAAGSVVITVTTNDGGYTAETSVVIDIPTCIDCDSTTLHIEAEDYSAMSGIRLQSCNDDVGGQNVGYIDGGDWMEYIIDVPVSGTYFIHYRVASRESNGGFDLTTDGVLIDQQVVPNTGGWQNWTTVVSEAITLQAGVQTFRFTQTSGNQNWNLNWFEINTSNQKLLQDIMSTDLVLVIKSVRIWPVPVRDVLNIESSIVLNETVTVYTANGVKIKQEQINGTTLKIDFSEVPNGIYFIIIGEDIRKLLK